MACKVLGIVGVLLLVWITAGWATATVDQQCGECHRKSVDHGMGKRFIHMPFLKKQCSACHLAGQPIAPPSKKDLQPVDAVVPEKIRWFRDAYGVKDEHWVRLPAGQVGEVLIVKSSAAGNRSPLQKLHLPPLQELPVKTDDGRAPLISALEVRDIRRGISTSATLAWETDEFTEAQVDYGVDGLTSRKVDGKLSRSHQMVLTGLDTGKTYTFRVRATDVFGHQAHSPPMTFTTDKTVIAATPRHEQQGAAAKLDYRLFRQGDSYLIEFQADRPVALALGVPQEEEPPPAERRVAAESTNVSHPVLKSELETNVRVCDSCHVYLKQSYSHPVNVFPKAGMVIPPDYPLLPDGRISCNSCHAEHGGDYEHRLIRSGKKELCLGCHEGY